jgi:WD40 repeat protein
MKLPAFFAGVALLPSLLLTTPTAQSPCADAAPAPVSREPIAFTEQQESDLGDAVAEQVERELRLVRDERNEYLQAIGARLLAAMPPTALRFSFVLVDAPELNAFALPGGRIYVSRKAVAFTRSEDELAGILAHEIGHVFTRQIAADLTRVFRDVLNVRQFGDRADVFRKYGQLHQALRASEPRERRREEQHQYEADRFALSAAVRAGYSADAYVALWDRYHEIGGRKGNFLSDFFNTTGPASLRLREMSRALEALPTACRATRAPELTETFASWRERVIADTTRSVASRATAVAEAAVSRALTPRLGTELHTLRFSPDGTWALAQDESTIYVLSRQPFRVTARIDAFDAFPARFTPDSRQVIVRTPDLRIERWDVASGRRAAVHELVIRDGCLGMDVSASGEWMACVDAELALSLIDVAAGTTVWKKDHAFPSEMILGISLLLFDTPIYRDTRDMRYDVRFSPDDRYLVAAGPTKSLALDLRDRTEVRLAEGVRRAVDRSFDFVGPDRIVAVNRRQPDKSELVTFPAGEIVKTLRLGGRITTATNARYAMLRPIQDWPLGVMDLEAGKIVMAFRTTAFDVHGQLHLGEQANGEVGLYGLDAAKPHATAMLPDATLGRVRALAVSPDLRWLAISGRDRGALWDLETGQRRVHLLGFTGAAVDDRGRLHADFPARKAVVEDKTVESARRVVRVEPGGRTSDHVIVEHLLTVLDGPVYVSVIPEALDDAAREGVIEVRETDSRRLLWSRSYKDGLPLVRTDGVENRVVLAWPLATKTARDAVAADQNLRKAARARAFRESAGWYVEVVEAGSGVRLGHLLSDSSRLTGIRASGGSVAIFDASGQIIVFDLRTGERRGSTFGRDGALSGRAGLLAVPDQSGRLDLYDLDTVSRTRSLQLPGRVRVARFSADGRKLLAVTADQTARVFDIQPAPDLTAPPR